MTLAVVLSIAALGVFSTGLGYVGNAVVLRAWGAQRTASITYLMPVVSVALGVAVLGERLERLAVAGGVVVVVGVLVGRGSSRRSDDPEAAQSLEPTADECGPDASLALALDLGERAPVALVDRAAGITA